MSDISKIKLASGKEYNIKDSYARELIGAHTHPIDTELDDVSTNPVQNSVITNALNNKADANHTHSLESIGIAYGECYSIENTSDKNVSLPNYVLCNNSIVSIKFKYAVRANATLNINNTGNKPIYYDGKSIIHNIINAGDTATFIYDGTNYNLISLDKNSRTQYFKINNEIISNSGKDVIYASNNSYSLIKNNIIYIKFKYFVYANARLWITPTGAKPIYYKDHPITDGIIKPNDIGVFIYDGTNYNLISVYPSSSACINSYYFSCTSYEGANHIVNITDRLVKFNKGDIITVYFSNNIDYSNATLKIENIGSMVNQNNGDLPIYYNGAPLLSGIIRAGDTAVFIYDETKYILLYKFDNSASLSLYDDNSPCVESATCETAAQHIAKETNLFKYSNIDIYYFAGAISYVTFENDVPANSTLNHKPIYYKGYPIIDGIIKAGDTAMFMSDGTNLHLISLTNENKYSSSNISNILFNIDRNKADNTHTHNIASMGFGFNFCNTTTETADKTVSISNYTLNLGSVVSIKFNYAVLANATLNINDTGAIPIYYKGSAITDDIINAGDTATFIYDGTNYNLISLDRNFNINNESMGFGYGTCSTAASTTAKTVSITNYKLTNGGVVSIKFTNDVPANATLNINDTDAKSIYYNGAAITDNIIKAGDTATFMYNGSVYNLISLDRDFNDPITIDSSLSTISTNPVQNSVITNALNNKADNAHTHNIVPAVYGYCSSTRLEVPKIVTINDFKLIPGMIIFIRFTYAVGNHQASLNISNTGAKPIYYKGGVNDLWLSDNNATGIIQAGDIVTFIYDGTNDRYNLISTNIISNQRMGSAYGYCVTGASVIEKLVEIKDYVVFDGGIVTIKFAYDVQAYSRLGINNCPSKHMYYKNNIIGNNIIKAGDIATFMYTGGGYQLISLDRDFNDPITIDSSLSTTSTNPVQNSAITNALNNKADANHTHTDATTSSGGLMSATDKANIDNFANNFKNKLSIANGIATLDSNGKVPSTQLPSYVDDIIEGYLYNDALYEEDTHTTEIIGETGKIYVDLSTNKTYRWSGSSYIEISESLALGETSSTAYRGDYGKIAYEHAQSTNNPHNIVPAVYGYCSSTKMEDPKIVTINDFKLIPGMIIFIRFTNGVRYQASLNISNTGAKPIYYKGKTNDLCVVASGGTEIIQADDIVTFIYDGTNDRYNLISTNIISNQRMGSATGFCETGASVSDKLVEIKDYVPFDGGIVTIKFVHDVQAFSRLKINNYSSVNMHYKNNLIGNNIIKAGDTATFMYNGSVYNLISLDRDFNDPITIDSSLSTISTNPVQNSAITNALNNYIPTIVGTQIESTNNWTGNAQFETLEDGQRILYYLPYDNSGYNVVLNLTLADGATQTGNINCYVQGSLRLTSHYKAGSFIPLIYKENITFNGSSTTYTGWWVYADKDIDTSTYLQLSNTKLKAGSNGIHGKQLVMQTDTDTWESLTTSYTTATTKTKNSKGFYLGKILYHNNDNIVTSGNYTGQWRIMEQFSNVNFSYSSNCGSTLVADKPVYLVGTINNGLFYLADTWWSQELPTTDDGKIYIYIGISYNNASIAKFAYNPIFWYNNGCVELYNGNGIKNINSNTTKAYLLGTTTNSADSGKQIYDNNVYLDTTAGELNTKSLKLNEKVTLNYNTNNNCIDFIFS